MRLEDVTAEIRPRVSWESIDLGCALARQHIRVIWKSWLVTVVPLWGVLVILLRDHPWWFLFCLWLLKPLYDRVVLFVVSRGLFGAVPSVLEVLRSWPRLIWQGWWLHLLIRRFSPSRSFALPISELEGLKGGGYRKRLNLLSLNGGEGASTATLAGMILELAAFVGILLFVFSMVPGEVSGRWQDGLVELFSHDDASQFSESLLWVIAAAWMLAMTFMEPFYVSAGFALYVNSRTLTEGWDIELAFKRLGARVSALKGGGKHTSLLLLLGVLMSGGGLLTEGAQAESGVFEDAAEVELAVEDLSELTTESEVDIERLIESDDFTIHTKVEKVRVDKSRKRRDWALPFSMSIFSHVIFFAILTAAIVGLGYVLYRNWHLFGGAGGHGVAERRGLKAREVMGMDVTLESLPADVVASARAAWQEGNHQLALSYLYRGAIGWFVNHEDLGIEEGDTEGDCLRRVGGMSDQTAAGQGQVMYFETLTKVWVRVAYGKNVPDDAVMEQLCDEWPFGQYGRDEILKHSEGGRV